MHSDDSNELFPVSPLRICPPVNYLCSPVNYFSWPLPNNIQNLIMSGLWISISLHISMMQLTMFMESLEPVSSSSLQLTPQFSLITISHCLLLSALTTLKLRITSVSNGAIYFGSSSSWSRNQVSIFPIRSCYMRAARTKWKVSRTSHHVSAVCWKICGMLDSKISMIRRSLKT